MVQVNLQSNILGANELLARKNRHTFKDSRVLAVNLMSSPGSGKTTILERTIEKLGDKLNLGVIEGDLYTDQDARRIEKKGVRVVQINTEGTCHLDAGMVGKAYEALSASRLDLVFIENVGNLVCPAEFDLGEDFRVVVISITEGNDKVLKYPLIFREARVVLVNKIDLLDYTDFNLEQFENDLKQVNPSALTFMVSARTGMGIDKWSEFLLEEVRAKIS
ncbi:hydrogenase nickel incorporation protein HypB [Syntrophomonas curvata]